MLEEQIIAEITIRKLQYSNPNFQGTTLCLNKPHKYSIYVNPGPALAGHGRLDHGKPHFHLKYQNKEIVVTIDPFEPLHGNKIPPDFRKLLDHTTHPYTDEKGNPQTKTLREYLVDNTLSIFNKGIRVDSEKFKLDQYR